MKKQKVKSRPKNAFVHGVHGSDVILPGEKLSEFNELLEGVRQDLTPHSTLEHQIVFDIAVLHWRKVRANRFAQIELMRTSLVRGIDKTGRHSAGAIVRNLDAAGCEKEAEPNDQVQRALSALERACEALNKRHDIWQKLRAEIGDLYTEIEELRPIIETAAARTEKKNTNATAFEIMEWRNKIVTGLDAEIDRNIKRLVMLKEYVRLYGQPAPKVIGQTAVIINQSPPHILERPLRDQSKSESKVLNPSDWEENDNDNDDEEMEDLKKRKAKQAQKR